MRPQVFLEDHAQPGEAFISLNENDAVLIHYFWGSAQPRLYNALMASLLPASLIASQWNDPECVASLGDLRGHMDVGVECDGYQLADLLNVLKEFWSTRGENPLRLGIGCGRIVRNVPHLAQRINTLLSSGGRNTRILYTHIHSPVEIDSILIVIHCAKGYICCIDGDEDEGPPFTNSSELSAYLSTHTVFHVAELLRTINTRWAPCVMELLQLELDNPQSTVPRADVITYIRYLSWLHEALPPSYYLSNISPIGKYPVNCGGFSDVWKGRIQKQIICVKVLRVFSETYQRRTAMNDLSSEVLLWRQLQHPNILQFLGVNDQDFAPSFAIVTPWMENGSLSSYLERRPFYGMSRKLRLARQVAEGLRYLHRHSPPIVHCDIKAGNILVSNDETCCIGDFGLSVVERSSPFSDFADSSEVRGSLRWLAPELITPGISDADTGDLGNACGRRTRDIYALGCTILEIITGNAPFYEQKSDMKIMIDVLNGVRPAYPKRCPGSIWELLEICWAEDMESRPEADEVLELLDEWLNKNEEDEGQELIEALDLSDEAVELEEDEQDVYERARADSPLLGIDDDEEEDVQEVPQVKEVLQNFFQSLLTTREPKRTIMLDSPSADTVTGSVSEASTPSPVTPTSPSELLESMILEDTPFIETLPAHWEKSKSDSELLLTPHKEELGKGDEHGQSEPLFPFRLPAESIWNDLELQSAWKWFRERRGRRRKGS